MAIYFGHPLPLQTQPPAEQSIVHVPSHAKLQLPPEQLNWHVAPGRHQAEQVPPEQSSVHGTFSAQ
jgi:hypothetical protein